MIVWQTNGNVFMKITGSFFYPELGTRGRPSQAVYNFHLLNWDH